MNTLDDRINAYIQANPRQCLQLVVVGICFIWMSIVCVFGLILYFILSKGARLAWWIILGAGLAMIMSLALIDSYLLATVFNLKLHLIHAFQVNKLVWKLAF